ncbi:MAG: UDP-2,4-diacetamido-2,4,6-trideoxy-beta-L-altropyranose hydrolase [Gammaproteobacteria bacterium]|nr:UDP-2,4-diacetamido-2,4,6-trideoxy-beta-L-altropyranose hydrolase [Gammaproteobacteria bacterium]MBU2181077.1 UDP-2,4-diacetamido-2,4,6-trideoxy-beta-L-altropyranose hydrolase [Gammaproteobacteria bacterium]MBU2225807.1 UDP-2,4-diacetamido-2,4,6-trideoxy-beta-L-altropyranose hydrolase [Gammaproteobacteria bacterium]
MQVLFRVDASVTIGSGHLMRCLTLAKAMHAMNWLVMFCCREHPGHQIDLLESHGFSCIRLPQQPCRELSEKSTQSQSESVDDWLGATEAEDAAATVAALQQANFSPDLLVIDHYALGRMFESTLRNFCRKILVIDDLANRPHNCDFLLDQNLLPDAHLRYLSWLAPDCQQYIGPAYALLRPEFVMSSNVQPLVKERIFFKHPFQLLVFFGGSDIDNLTSMAIKAMQQLQNPQWLADIVIGSANPHLTLLQQLCEEDHRLTLHVQTPGMAGLMAKAQLMIGAGGSTHWERCAMALPALVMSLAPNQQPTSAYLAELGACVYLGAGADLTSSRLSRELAKLVGKPKQLQQMAGVASGLVAPEGGCQRLLDSLTNSLGTRHPEQ